MTEDEMKKRAVLPNAPARRDYTVREERTGWRDARLSIRHREYGYNVPCVNLDFPVIEIDNGHAVALLEHKHELAKPVDSEHPGMRGLKEFADRRPFFVVRYADDFAWYEATAMNDAALTRFSIALKTAAKTVRFSEVGYATTFLHVVLRGRTPPAGLADHIREIQARDREAKAGRESAPSDAGCLEVARQSLSDTSDHNNEARIRELASVIQQTVDNYTGRRPNPSDN